MAAHTPTLGETRAAWRAAVVEDVLWPTQRICDAHHHLWDYDNDRYLAADLAADVRDGHRVVQTVFMECEWGYREKGPLALRPVGETEFVVKQAAEVAAIVGQPVITGIVGFADLRLGTAVKPVLEAHEEAGHGLFRGIRHAVAWDPSPEIVNHHLNPPPRLLLDPLFVDGVRTLGEMGLTYDVWLFHQQLPEVIELARLAPATTIIVDHLGGPLGVGPYTGRRDEVLSYCREQLKELATIPNVRLKLGGVGMTTYGNGWHKLPTPPSSDTIAAAWGDYTRWCIDTFGPSRVMFESNFPPDRRSCGYRTLWNAYKKIAAPYYQGERDRMFHDTAVEVYKLSSK
jgi:L-fuconolactonase